MPRHAPLRAPCRENRTLRLIGQTIIASPLIFLISSLATAETYQTIAGIGAYKQDTDGAKATYALGGRYFFSGQETLGPLDQFAYLDDTTMVHESASKRDDRESFTLGGEYYFSDFSVGARYSDFDGDASVFELNASYFILDNLKASINHNRWDVDDEFADVKDVTSASLAYDHAINDTDYLAATVWLNNDNINSKGISGKYLNAFSNGQYLVMNAGHSTNDDSSSYLLDGKWYYNNNTGILLGYSSSDSKNIDSSFNTKYIGITHFFTSNFVMDARLEKNNRDIYDYTENHNSGSLSARLQF